MWGAFYGLRAAARQMIQQGDGGNMVVISSVHALEAVPTSMAYNMAKGCARPDGANGGAGTGAGAHTRQHRVSRWTDTPGERKYFSEETLQEAGAISPWAASRGRTISRAALFFLVDPGRIHHRHDAVHRRGTQLPYWSGRARGEF